MGLRNWLIKRLVKKKLGGFTPSINSQAADELLKLSQDKYTNTLKTAEKINKANLFRLKEKQLKQEVIEGLNGEEEDEEEEEEEDDEGLKILQNVLLPMITNKEKFKTMDVSKLIGMAEALPPEELQKLLKTLKLA